MSHVIKIISKYLVLFGIGGLVYCGIELLWRGYSHFSMIIVGGVCFIAVGLINEFFSWEMPLMLQMLIAACIITAIELIAGLVLNIGLGLAVWDYGEMPMNVMGQICLPYFALWYLLSAVAVILDDWLRYGLFGEEKPRYKLI